MLKSNCKRMCLKAHRPSLKVLYRKRLFTISSLFRSLKINSTSSSTLPSVTAEPSCFWWCFMVWSRLQHKHTHLSVITFVWYLSTCRGCKGLPRCFYALPSCVTHPMTSGNTDTGRTREAVLANISLVWAESTRVYRPPPALRGEKRSFSFSDSQPKQTEQMNRKGETHWTHIIRSN